MAGQHAKDKQRMTLWLSKEQIALLEQVSERTGLSKTELIAKALRMAGTFRAVPDKKQ